MKKLYMITLGGKAKGANIEVHDVQFAIGENVEDTIELVRENWYGIQEKLHLDSYKEIQGVENYKITLSKEKVESDKKLYFVYLGDYKLGSTEEKHEAVLIIAESQKEAEEKAMALIKMDEVDKHVDSISIVEDIILTRANEKYYLTFEEVDANFDTKADWQGYWRIDK